ncbi:hypothetical protein NKH18_49885 [Streptomyces sp. M10(2022)]
MELHSPSVRERRPDTGAWSVTEASFALPANGAPATYPSSYRGCHWGVCTAGSGLPLRVGDLTGAHTSWSTRQVDSGAYNASMDLWLNSTPVTDAQPDGTEVMIWMNHRGGVQPIGSHAATVQLDGRSWDVWTGPGASGWKVVSYVLQGGATEFADLDVLGLIDDAVARGSIDPAHYLIDVEAGFEIWQGGQGLGTDSFSFTASGPDAGAPMTADHVSGSLARERLPDLISSNCRPCRAFGGGGVVRTVDKSATA